MIGPVGGVGSIGAVGMTPAITPTVGPAAPTQSITTPSYVSHLDQQSVGAPALAGASGINAYNIVQSLETSNISIDTGDQSSLTEEMVKLILLLLLLDMLQ